MTPIRGRSPKGTRCIGGAPYGHWHTTTFICALRTQGLVAPLVLDGPINGTTCTGGDVMVMDAVVGRFIEQSPVTVMARLAL